MSQRNPIHRVTLRDIAGLSRHQFEMGAAAGDLVAGELAIGQSGIPDIPKTVQLECSWKPGPTVRS